MDFYYFVETSINTHSAFDVGDIIKSLGGCFSSVNLSDPLLKSLLHLTAANSICHIRDWFCLPRIS